MVENKYCSNEKGLKFDKGSLNVIIFYYFSSALRRIMWSTYFLSKFGHNQHENNKYLFGEFIL